MARLQNVAMGKNTRRASPAIFGTFPLLEKYKQKPAHATARVDNRNSKPTKTARRVSKPPEEALARQGKKGLAFLPCKCYNIHCKDRLLSILFAGVMT